MSAKKLDYHKLVNYDIADPAKILAQKEGFATASNMPFGFSELEGTRGESAYVFDMGDLYGAFVQEGLGTKSLITQKVYEETGKSYFANTAQDTVGTIINDLISVGAKPIVMNAYWSASSFDWLADKKLTTDFIKGWRNACDEAGVVWGGGETQSLPGVVEKGALEFAGCGFGVIKPKDNLVNEKKLQTGDKILLLGSNGVHANGISLTRKIADKLKDGYQTKLDNGEIYGEALLSPSILYAKVLEEFRKAEIDIHYIANITGHGWRKLMRASREFTYVIETIPEPHEVFSFIQKHSNNTLEDMYANYNMGAGYAVYLSDSDGRKAIEVAKKLGINGLIAGSVEKGPRQVKIKPLGISYAGETLEVKV